MIDIEKGFIVYFEFVHSSDFDCIDFIAFPSGFEHNFHTYFFDYPFLLVYILTGSESPS